MIETECAEQSCWARTQKNAEDDDPYTVRHKKWSLGLKRNIAAHVASGANIAHFDDDDLYASNYLQIMYDEMCKKTAAAVGKEAVQRGEHPVVVTLQHWHMLDLPGVKFRWMDPETDPLVLKKWVKAMQYGYGFSYMYTATAWDQHPFPDLETREDDVWMDDQKRHPQRVHLIEGGQAKGLVAHTFHTDSTSGGEFNCEKRLGKIVSAPENFEDLLSEVQKLAAILVKIPESPHLKQWPVPAWRPWYAWPPHGSLGRKGFGAKGLGVSAKGKGKGKGMGIGLRAGQGFIIRPGMSPTLQRASWQQFSC